MDVIQELRHYCRNPRCRSKLPAPASNPREAFCTRGCHGAFYRTRCLICEGSMVRNTENQKLCGKRKCRSALRLGRQLRPNDFTDALINESCSRDTPRLASRKVVRS